MIFGETYSAEQKSRNLMILLSVLTAFLGLMFGMAFTSGIDDEQCVNYNIYKGLIDDFNKKLKVIDVNTIINDGSINVDTVNTLLSNYKIISDLTTFVALFIGKDQLGQISVDSNTDYDKTNIKDIKDKTYKDSEKSATTIKQNIATLIDNINKVKLTNEGKIAANIKLIDDNNIIITKAQANNDINQKNLATYKSNDTKLNKHRNEQIEVNKNINDSSYITSYRTSIKDKILNYENDKINIQKQIYDNNSLLLKNKNAKNTKSDMIINYQTKISTCINI